MHPSDLCDVRAIASRDAGRAADAARAARVPVSHGSYEALLADPEIEAVYIPLPNHLHVEWSIRALEAGKHVLCEKPIACTADELAPLVEARERSGLHVEEAVMVRDHPQWTRVRALIDSGRIGELRNVQLSYSHFTDEPGDIRNRQDAGGGGLLDVGSYCSAIARLIFDAEPLRAMALVDPDPRFGTDRFVTALLEFPGGHASFFCSTQSSRCQMAQIVGTTGWMRAEVPFAHPPDLPARLLIGSNVAPGTEPEEVVRFRSGQSVPAAGGALRAADSGRGAVSLADRDRGREHAGPRCAATVGRVRVLGAGAGRRCHLNAGAGRGAMPPERRASATMPCRVPRSSTGMPRGGLARPYAVSGSQSFGGHPGCWM